VTFVAMVYVFACSMYMVCRARGACTLSWGVDVRHSRAILTLITQQVETLGELEAFRYYHGPDSTAYADEYGWSFFQAVYFVMVTISTVGYGDYRSASRPQWRWRWHRH
jgi:hypothetical protein